MRDHKKVVRTAGAYLLTMAAIMIIGMILFAAAKEHQRTTRIDVLKAEQQEKLEQLESKNEALQEYLDYLTTDTAKIRKLYENGYQEEGESVAYIKDSNIIAEEQEMSVDDTIRVKPYRAWYSLFFGKKE